MRDNHFLIIHEKRKVSYVRQSYPSGVTVNHFDENLLADTLLATSHQEHASHVSWRTQTHVMIKKAFFTDFTPHLSHVNYAYHVSLIYIIILYKKFILLPLQSIHIVI